MDIVEILLTKGQVTFVSKEDADLAELKWFALADFSPSKGTEYRVARNSRRNNGKRPLEYMHRTIMSRILGRPLLTSERVDHRDLNPLNNHRDNLRLATPSQNGVNARKQSNNTSGHKGVYRDKRCNKWRVMVTSDRKHYWFGGYDTFAEACEVYRREALRLQGEFARFE